MASKQSAVKASAERDVFAHFAMQLGEQELWLSIESKDPPHPDLVCVHRELGPIAFELVAITDPLIASINAGSSKHTGYSFWTSDPTERIIRKKLDRKYETTHPIELLIYSDMLVITHDESIIETTVNWLGSKDHPFRRAWFMGEFKTIPIWQNDA